MSATFIETIDMEDCLNERYKEDVAAFIKEILSDKGFFFLKNHGISDELVSMYLKTSKTFFTLTEEQKRQYEYIHLKHQVGWTPPGMEKGEFSHTPDRKEFFQIGDIYPWPYVDEVPTFAREGKLLFESFRATYRKLLPIIAQSLGLENEQYFLKKEGNSIMRSILYPADPHPPVDDEAVEGEETVGGNVLGMCASRHTDINILTLLFARKKGLQLKYNGHYEEVTVPDPNLIIVNSGDILQHLTGGLYKSGMHRVVCEPNIERQSVPFFGHVLPNTSIVPIFKERRDVEKYPYKTAGRYLNARLKQIGLT